MKTKKSPVPLRIISLILLLLWAGLIFCLSHQNAEASSNVSGSLIETVVNVIMPEAEEAQVEKTIADLQFIVRKSAHFTAYGILGILAFLTFVTYTGLPLGVRVLFSLLISYLYSVSDEYHQTFIPGRSGELRDILIDTGGALLGIIFCLIIYSVRVAKMRKKQYIELTDVLQKKLHSEKEKTEELTAENKKLSAQLEALSQRLVRLEECVPSKEETAIKEAPATQPEPEEKAPSLSEDTLNGAKIIGKIVLSSAKYCNSLTTADVDGQTKELVNLILGRTEVAKAEILRISSLALDSSEKQRAMEQELSNAEDYFKSVMAQK